MVASIMLVGPYGLLWTYCSRPYAAYVICAILWTSVLTPKVIMYTVGPPGYKYPLCTSSTLIALLTHNYTLLATLANTSRWVALA
jgi:hypothetical protein